MARSRELKCDRCKQPYEQDFRKLEVCDQCNEEIEAEKEFELLDDETTDSDEEII